MKGIPVNLNPFSRVAAWFDRRAAAADAKSRDEVRRTLLASMEARVNELHARNGGDDDESRAVAHAFHVLRAEWFPEETS